MVYDFTTYSNARFKFTMLAIVAVLPGQNIPDWVVIISHLTDTIELWMNKIRDSLYIFLQSILMGKAGCNNIYF